MIFNKEHHQVRQVEPSTGTKRTLPAHDDVLTDLFRARMGEGGPLVSPSNHEEPQRAAPLVSSLASPPLFQVSNNPKTIIDCDWSSASLFRQIGQSKRFKQDHSSVLDNKQSTFSFPLNSELFLPSSYFNESLSSAGMNGTPSNDDCDEILINQSLRSLRSALRVTGQSTTISELTMNNRRKRPLNQATRIRLVGQMLGQERVQKVVSVVKEIKQCPGLANDEFVDAWEFTPVDALKALPWEDLLRSAEERLQAQKNGVQGSA